MDVQWSSGCVWYPWWLMIREGIIYSVVWRERVGAMGIHIPMNIPYEMRSSSELLAVCQPSDSCTSQYSWGLSHSMNREDPDSNQFFKGRRWCLDYHWWCQISRCLSWPNWVSHENGSKSHAAVRVFYFDLFIDIPIKLPGFNQRKFS